MTDINKLIEETERLLAAATPGPWASPTGQAIFRLEDDGDSVCVATAKGGRRDDGKLIAHAPAALRALVDEVNRLRRQVTQLEFDRTTQPNADWQPNSKTVAPATLPEYPIRTCSQCRYFPDVPESDGQGEHHPACEHAPANPRNAGPRYCSPASYEGNAGDSDADPV